MLLRGTLILVPWNCNTRNDILGPWNTFIRFHFVNSKKINVGKSRSKIEIGFLVQRLHIALLLLGNSDYAEKDSAYPDSMLPGEVWSASSSPCGFCATDPIFGAYNHPISLLDSSTEQARNIFSAFINDYSVLWYFLSGRNPGHRYSKWHHNSRRNCPGREY